jgi:hypothetical protein
MSNEQGNESTVSRSQSMKEDEMAKEKEAPKKLSRKEFVKGAAAMAGAGALVSCAPAATPAPECPPAPDCPPAEECAPCATPWLPQKWDYEADVVVVGYGFAGACAAIAATDAGADVLILEKSATAEGGNSGCSTGSIHTYLDVEDPEEWVRLATRHSWGTTNEELIRAYVSDALETKDWLESLGMELELYEGRASARRPGGWNGRIVVPDLDPDLIRAAGNEVFAFEHGVVTERGIDIMFSTPAKELIQDPGTKEILGVKALAGVTLVQWSPEAPFCYTGGEEIYVKAKKGVILACGGYEGNPEMQYNFNYPGLRLYPWGTPYNTGDGILMSSAAGAEQWHLHGLEWSAVNFKKATESVGHTVPVSATTAITPDNHIFVNRYGKRFMNETKNMGHDIGHKAATDFDASKSEYPNMPFFCVFDDTLFKAGPLSPEFGRTGTKSSYNSVHRSYEWSDDNSAELEKGWIFKADTISELAAKIKGTDFFGDEWGVDPEALVETVGKYNADVELGEDTDFARDPERLAPVVTPPFYAVEMALSCINTQGGPVRDANYQAVGTDGNPIPRLYGVGELGSINGFEYVAGNITEAHTTGRVAGQNAAALEDWA